MSISQFISTYIFGHEPQDSLCHCKQNTQSSRCNEAVARLNHNAEENSRIQHETVFASRKYKDSSVAVVECLTCPTRVRTVSGGVNIKDLP